MAFPASYHQRFQAEIKGSLWSNPEVLSCFGESLGEWHVHTVTQQGTEVLWLPHFVQRIPLGRVSAMPPFLRYCVPLIHAELTPAQASDALQLALVQLSECYGMVSIAFDPMISRLIPEDYSFAEWRPTYCIALSPKVVPSTLPNKSMRKRLRKAANHWTLTRGALSPLALHILEAPFARQQIATPFNAHELQILFDKLAQLGAAVSHQATNSTGELEAVSVVLTDQHTAYCLLSGSSEAARANDGGSFVLAQDVAFAHDSGLSRVDFLGSALPGPAQNRRQLGGKLEHYAHVRTDSSWWAKLRRRLMR